MEKPKYKLGQQIYKYNFENNSIEELMINQIIIEYGACVTLGELNFKDISTKILYRLANRHTANQYVDIIEFEINKTFYFTNKDLLSKELLSKIDDIKTLS